MNILITGSSGFLGKKLADKIGSEFVGFDIANSVLETLDNSKLLKSKLKNIDLVYHLAGITDSSSPNLYKVNVDGTKCLMEAINSTGRDVKVVFASSFAVYKTPKKGEAIDEGYPVEPRNKYGESKLVAEKLILQNPKNIVLRFSNIYGPGMSSGRHSVIANFIEAISSSGNIYVYDKDATRDFVYIDDVVKALILSKELNTGGIFNICSGQETSVLELIKIIEGLTGKTANIDLSKKEKNGGFWKGDFKRASQILNWRPSVDIRNGLNKILNSN